MKAASTAEYDKWHEHLAAEGENSNPLVFPWYQSASETILQKPMGEILEVGCGRGQFATWLANLAPELHVTGLDFSVAAIALAKTNAARSVRAVQFSIGDAQNLPFPDHTFDWIVSCECMEHVKDPRRMAAEMFRVLKPSGRFCLTTENYFNGMLLAWLKSWITRQPFDSGSGVQPIEKFFVFFQVLWYLRNAGLVVDKTESSHCQWLLLPRVDPARLCTLQFHSGWARRLAKPFGRHFTFCGFKP